MSEKRKKILVLGAGRIAIPCVSYLLSKGYEIAISDLSIENLNGVTDRCHGIQTIVADASEGYGTLIDEIAPDLVMCLLPPRFMTSVMAFCAKKGIHLVHPAYLDDAQRAMAADIKKSGAVMIAELGLDPGIDHMSAARTIIEAHRGGYEVESFRSICGALPSAEANDNPWGYKLSWAPESLIGASRRTARVMLDGVEHLWSDGETFEHIYLTEIEGLGWFEVYANADSMVYRDLYAIPEVRTIYRGTLRYLGWSETISAMNRLGLTTVEEENLRNLTVREYVARKLGVPVEKVRDEFCARLGLKQNSSIYQRMDWIGFFDDIPIPNSARNAQDVMSLLFGKKLIFKRGERDLIALVDEFILRNKATGKRVKVCSRLVDFGVPEGDSAIARTTGYPPAIVAHLILTGEISTPGLHIPALEEIYEPALRELEKMGFALKEERMALD